MPAQKRNPDRRVSRTHEALLAALLSLMAEKGYDAISVQDILERANVGRSTFYGHFTGKSALLMHGFEGLEQALRDHAAMVRDNEAEAQRSFYFSLPLLQHASDHKQIFQAMVGRRSGFVVQMQMQKLILDQVKQELANSSTASSLPPLHLEARAQLSAGAFYSLMTWWLEGASHLAAEDVDEMFQSFCRKGLA